MLRNREVGPSLPFILCIGALLVGHLGLVPHPSRAQVIGGYVSGILTDPTGATLRGVTVTLVNSATNDARQVISNSLGFYRFVAVDPGTYSLEFALPGFETYQFDSLIVAASREVVINTVLRLGSLRAEVSIFEQSGVNLDKATPAIQRTFPSDVVTGLPIQMHSGVRDVSRLVLLAPGVVRASSFTEFSANGQRSRNNSFMLDGTDNNDLSVSLNSVRVIPEAVAEIQVRPLSYSVEFGRSSGAQFSAVTRSGTNRRQVELWEYYRGSWMEPLSLANRRSGMTRTPRSVLNQIGGSVGGALIENRAFYFGLLDANRRREAPNGSGPTASTIPTEAGYAALAGLPLGPGETSEARQAALSALKFLPEIARTVTAYQNVRTVPINGVPIEVATISVPVARPSDFWYSVGRLDGKPSAIDNVGYRYHLDRSTQTNFTGNLQFGSRFTADQKIERQNHGLNWTHTFSHSDLNEARFAYTRGRLQFPERAPADPTIIINNFFTIGGLSVFPQGRLEELAQLQDVVTRVRGRHSLKSGVDIRRNRLLARFGAHSKGTWVFPTLANFLNNNALSLIQAVNDSTFDASQWNNAYFVQDDIRVGRNVTVNAGVRFEYSTVPLGFFGATDPAIRAIGVPGPARPDKNNFAPRVGLAYSPDNLSGWFGRIVGPGQTAFRVGFGVHYDVLFYGILSTTSNNYPRVITSTTTAPATANLFPALAPKDTAIPPLDPITSTFVNVPEDIQRPTTHVWSLSVQRQLGSRHIVELGYLGNRSYHQLRRRDANPGVLTAEQAAAVLGGNRNIRVARLNPEWGARTLIEAAAKAEYHGGYVKFDRRLAKGFLFGANYTWSANFSDNDEAFGLNDITASSPEVPQYSFNYRDEWSRSAFDRPHRFAAHYVLDTPWFSSGVGHRVLNKAFGGWQISGVLESQSGQPFTIRTGVDTVGSFSTAFPGRPDFNPGGVLRKDPVSGDLRTFTIPLDGTGIVVAPMGSDGILPNSMPQGGNLGRNTLRGPSFFLWNFALMKTIPFSDRLRIQIRADFANVLNHDNFQNPVAVMSSTDFGRNIAPLLTDSRQTLLSIKLRF